MSPGGGTQSADTLSCGGQSPSPRLPYHQRWAQRPWGDLSLSVEPPPTPPPPHSFYTHTQVLSSMARWCTHTEKITLHGEGGLYPMQVQLYPHPPATLGLPTVVLRPLWAWGQTYSTLSFLYLPSSPSPNHHRSSLFKGLMPAMASCDEDLQSYIGRTRCVRVWGAGGREGGYI